MKPNARALAALAVAEVVGQGRSLSAVLPALLDQAPARDRALVQELAYGTLRWYPRLELMLAALLQKPLKDKERELQALLLVGLYQLGWLSLAPHGIVHASVEAARQLGKDWAGKLVNAVLRNFQRQRAAIEAGAIASEAGRHAHPAWLLQHWQRDWPEHWQAIAAAGNERPPMSLRVNARRQSRTDYLQTLHGLDPGAEVIAGTEQGICLSAPLAVEALPGFAAGLVSVQDGAAQLAAQLLDVQPGMRVLDACAAPGGKTGHILERTAELAELLALDQDAERLQRVRENLDRLGLQARLVAADAAAVASWWDGQPFDRILLDAPCSASGVIRRHPDIKVLRRAQDIGGLVVQQRRLLDSLWPLLVPGGMLVYCTCSVLRAENTEPLQAFLQDHPEAREQPIRAEWGYACAVGRQLLPGEQDMDGFYYACIQKRP
jgi:16S rRNA (cytosine967-C5)-methyltransferase